MINIFTCDRVSVPNSGVPYEHTQSIIRFKHFLLLYHINVQAKWSGHKF